MRIATAMRRMQVVLGTVDPPDRQVKAVQDWTSDVHDVLIAGESFMISSEIDIDDRPRRSRLGWKRPPEVRFLYGTGTHRAWRDLCLVVLAYLHGCEFAADRARHAAQIDVEVAARNGALPATVERLQARVAQALAWQLAARHAIRAGESLIGSEDAIQVPVGRAIHRVGLREVATDKRYHQKGARR